jgi:hypothetical protein
MYWHSRSKDEAPREGKYSDENPAYKKRFHDTQDQYANVKPRDLSPLRRLAIKKMRYQGKTSHLVAEAAAIRRLMEREINR